MKDIYAFIHLALVALIVVTLGYVVVYLQDMNQLKNKEVICFEDYTCKIESIYH